MGLSKVPVGPTFFTMLQNGDELLRGLLDRPGCRLLVRCLGTSLILIGPLVM